VGRTRIDYQSSESSRGNRGGQSRLKLAILFEPPDFHALLFDAACYALVVDIAFFQSK
jgi:hypothetical protein